MFPVSSSLTNSSDAFVANKTFGLLSVITNVLRNRNQPPKPVVKLKNKNNMPSANTFKPDDSQVSKSYKELVSEYKSQKQQKERIVENKITDEALEETLALRKNMFDAIVDVIDRPVAYTPPSEAKSLCPSNNNQYFVYDLHLNDENNHIYDFRMLMPVFYYVSALDLSTSHGLGCSPAEIFADRHSFCNEMIDAGLYAKDELPLWCYDAHQSTYDQQKQNYTQWHPLTAAMPFSNNACGIRSINATDQCDLYKQEIDYACVWPAQPALIPVQNGCFPSLLLSQQKIPYDPMEKLSVLKYLASKKLGELFKKHLKPFEDSGVSKSSSALNALDFNVLCPAKNDEYYVQDYIVPAENVLYRLVLPHAMRAYQLDDHEIDDVKAIGIRTPEDLGFTLPLPAYVWYSWFDAWSDAIQKACGVQSNMHLSLLSNVTTIVPFYFGKEDFHQLQQGDEIRDYQSVEHLRYTEGPLYYTHFYAEPNLPAVGDCYNGALLINDAGVNDNNNDVANCLRTTSAKLLSDFKRATTDRMKPVEPVESPSITGSSFFIAGALAFSTCLLIYGVFNGWCCHRRQKTKMNEQTPLLLTTIRSNTNTK